MSSYGGAIRRPAPNDSGFAATPTRRGRLPTRISVRKHPIDKFDENMSHNAYKQLDSSGTLAQHAHIKTKVAELIGEMNNPAVGVIHYIQSHTPFLKKMGAHILSDDPIVSMVNSQIRDYMVNSLTGASDRMLHAVHHGGQMAAPDFEVLKTDLKDCNSHLYNLINRSHSKWRILGGVGIGDIVTHYTAYTKIDKPKLNLSAMFVIALTALILNEDKSDEAKMCAETYLQLLEEYNKICGTVSANPNYISAKAKANKAIKDKEKENRRKKKEKRDRDRERKDEGEVEVEVEDEVEDDSTVKPGKRRR